MNVGNPAGAFAEEMWLNDNKRRNAMYHAGFLKKVRSKKEPGQKARPNQKTHRESNRWGGWNQTESRTVIIQLNELEIIYFAATDPGKS